MKNIGERADFEKKWRDFFEEAEKAPPELVWERIDASLSRSEAGNFKKRILFFKLLAAAAITFALGISGYYYYALESNNPAKNHVVSDNNNKDQIKDISDDRDLPSKDFESSENQQASLFEKNDGEVDPYNNTDPSTKIDAPENSVNSNLTANHNHDVQANTINAAEDNSDNNSIGSSDLQSEGYRVVFAEDNSSDPGIENPAQNMTVLSVEKDDDVSGRLLVAESSNNRSYDYKYMSSIGPSSEFEESSLEYDHLYMVPVMPDDIRRNHPKSKEAIVFIAGIDIAPGVFNPNFSYENNAISNMPANDFVLGQTEYKGYSLNSNVTPESNRTSNAQDVARPDVSYSYGASFGMKLVDRIVISTGFQYTNATTNTNTDQSIIEASSKRQLPLVANYQYDMKGLSTIQSTESIELTNTYQFASIPFKAGYIVYEKKLNVIVSAGFSSDFFINSQIKDKANSMEVLDNGPGDNSIYKDVYFNGMLSTSLGYKIGQNYTVSLEPNYRFALNSFTKDDFYMTSRPTAFMVSFGLKYIFR